MSSLKALPLKLAPKARQDFIDILRYTGESWGQTQLLTYRDKINDALQAISQNPQLGHRRDALLTTHLAYLVGSHVSFIAPARTVSTSCASCISA